MRARLEGAMAQRRLRGWNPPLENINSLVASGGPRLLARARELVVTNGYAANACEAFAANLVGDGIKPSSLIEDAGLRDRIQRLWLAWTDEADADGLDRLLRAAGHGGAGDVRGGRMLRAPSPAPGGGRAAWCRCNCSCCNRRCCPSRRLETAANGNRIRCGIEFDAIGRRVAYHFRRRHPGDSTDQGAVIPETVRVAGRGRAAHLPADRRRPDPGPAACGARHGAAVSARPVRRCRTRPEEDRGDVRGIHHQDRAGRAA